MFKHYQSFCVLFGILLHVSAPVLYNVAQSIVVCCKEELFIVNEMIENIIMVKISRCTKGHICSENCSPLSEYKNSNRSETL